MPDVPLVTSPHTEEAIRQYEIQNIDVRYRDDLMLCARAAASTRRAAHSIQTHRHRYVRRHIRFCKRH